MITDDDNFLSQFNILIPILRKYDNKITEADLINPEPNNLLGILCAILEHLGMQLQMILEPQPHSEALFANNPVSYKSTVKQLNIFMIVKYLISHFNVIDFNFEDISRPRQQRVIELLNILTTLIQLKEESEEIFCKKLKEIIAYEEKIKALEERHKYLEEIIPSKILEMEQLKVSNENKTQEIGEYELELTKYKTLVESQSKNLEKLKKEFTDLTDRLKTIKMENSNLQSEIESLSNNIVKSPQKIIEEAESCQNDLNHLCKQMNDLKQKLNDSTQEKTNLTQIVERIKTCVNLPDGIFHDIGKLQEVESSLNKLKEKGDELANSIQQEKFDIQLHTEHLEVTLKATQQLEINVERKRDEVKKKLEHLQNTKVSNLTEIKDLQLTFKQLENKRKQLEEDLNKLNEGEEDLDRYNELCQLSSMIENFENFLDS